MKYKIAIPRSIYELGKRANQEDNIYPTSGEATVDDRLFIVCDGMGGHESGEIASSTVCNVMSSYIKDNICDDNFDESLFKSALSAAYDALDALDEGNSAKKMGTTMTFMMLHNAGCFLAHIGDSRIFHVRAGEGREIYISRDHSLINALYDVGEITLEEMKTSTQKNVITRAIQPHQDRRAEATIRNVTDIMPGDYFYLCTDGMLENIENEHIINIISMGVSDEEKIEILTTRAEENRDNHSAYLIKIEDVEGCVKSIECTDERESVVEEEQPVVDDDVDDVDDVEVVEEQSIDEAEVNIEEMGDDQEEEREEEEECEEELVEEKSEEYVDNKRVINNQKKIIILLVVIIILFVLTLLI